MYSRSDFLLIIAAYEPWLYMFNDFYEESSDERSYTLHVVSGVEYSSRSGIRISMDLITFGEKITIGLYFIPT